MTDYVYLKGKLSWVRPDKPDQWGNYKATIHPDAESLEKVRELAAEGVKNIIKKDEDGYYVTYKRPTQKVYNGRVQGFAPVEILDGNTPLPGGGFSPLRDMNVGNGSSGIMKLQVYSHKTPSGGKAKAARLESIRIDNLVPFTSARDSFEPDQAQAMSGFDDKPPVTEQLF